MRPKFDIPVKVLRTIHPLGWFVGFTAFLWTLAVLIPLVDHSTWYPGYPFFDKEQAFTDLTIFVPQFRHFRQPDFYTVSNFPLTYPAFGCLLLEGLLASSDSVQTLCAVVAASVLVGLVLTRFSLVRQGLPGAAASGLLLYLAFTSFPLYFDLLRGNIEFLNCVCLAIGFALCWHKRWNAGAVFLGLAVALKIYPVIVLGFLLAQRKYRATLVALLSAGLATLGSLAILGPSIGIAQQHISAGLAYFSQRWVVALERSGMPFDHSLFGAYRLLADTATHQADFLHASRIYLLVVVALALVLYLWRIIRLPAVNQAVILVALAVLMPPVSYDYTLLALYIPWALLACYSLRLPPGNDPRRQTLLVSFLCLAWLLSPETYLGPFAGLSRCLALLALIAVQCRTPLPTRDEYRQTAKAMTCLLGNVRFAAHGHGVTAPLP